MLQPRCLQPGLLSKRSYRTNGTITHVRAFLQVVHTPRACHVLRAACCQDRQGPALLLCLLRVRLRLSSGSCASCPG